MNWLRTCEGKKQKKLNFKSNYAKKGRPQKHKNNVKAGGGDWKTKLHKTIKANERLESIVSIMANEY